MNRSIPYLSFIILFILSSCSMLDNSNDATLKSITVSSGTLDPTFSSKKTDYTIEVNAGLLTLTPVPNHPLASLAVKIDDQSYAYVPWNETIKVPLQIGDNKVQLKVVAEDGVTEKIYTIVTDATPILSFAGLDTAGVSSGLTIKNTSSSTKTVTGFYLTSLDIGSTQPCFGSVVGGNNLFGALWSPIEIPADGKISFDQNYLYNAMSNFLYQLVGVVGSTPFDTPGATPSWCITLGLAGGTPLAQLMNAAGASQLTHNTISGNAAEEAIVSCDDTTFTCTATPAVEQLFPR